MNLWIFSQTLALKKILTIVTMTIVTEESTAVARMETGEADFMPNVTVGFIPRIEAMPNVQFETSNAAEVMFFTDKCQVYKSRLSDFDDTKASALGDYLPARLGMDEGESVVYMVLPGDYRGWMLFFFENGKAAKVELSAYRTTSNRRKLTGAYSDKSPLRTALCLREDCELAVYSTEPRVLVFSTALLGSKTTRATQGVAVLTLKKKFTLDYACPAEATGIANLARYRARSLPAVGALLKAEDSDEKQISLMD